MGVSRVELARRYPRLYHAAEYGSWESISRHGLLSTIELLRLFGQPEREELVASQRRDSVRIHHPDHGWAVIRDQSVLSETKLARCLEGCDVRVWFRLLNERSFFWLDRKRLATFLGARLYRDKLHTLLTLDTDSILQSHWSNVTLSPMNTGNTQPFAHPRGPGTFRHPSQYPFHERRSRGRYGQVVELCVTGGVPDVSEHVLKVENVSLRDGEIVVEDTLLTAAIDSGRLT